MKIQDYWMAVFHQDAKKMRPFFNKDAYIDWPCSNERFTVDEFIIANCEYPGAWEGTVERIETIDNKVISTAHVYSKDHSLSFHVASFMQIEDNQIIAMEEFWGEDGLAPQWRIDKKIGTRLHELSGTNTK